MHSRLKYYALMFSLLALSSLLFPSSVFAKIYINEFYSATSNDWIEVYNSGPDPVDLSLYRLRDNTLTNKLDLTGNLEQGKYATFDWYNKLNKHGDVIKLVLISDETQVEDQVAYGDVENAIVSAPSETQSAGRERDGEDNWTIFSSSSKNSSNNHSFPAPTDTPTPSPTEKLTLSPTRIPTPSKTPTPTKTPTPIKTPTLTKTPTPMKATPTGEKLSLKKLATQSVGVATSIPLSTTPVLSRDVPTVVLGLATTDEVKTPEYEKKTKALVKGEQRKKTYVIVLSIFGVICIVCAILLFLRQRFLASEDQ